MNDLLKKSPKATIGNQSRFPRKCSLNDHIGNLPDQYVKNHSKMQAKPIKLGTFYGEKRWNEAPVTPGVGDYDLTGFKNIAKANETNFGAVEKVEMTQSMFKANQKMRAKSA